MVSSTVPFKNDCKPLLSHVTWLLDKDESLKLIYQSSQEPKVPDMFKNSYEISKNSHSLVLKAPIQASVNGTYKCRFFNGISSTEDVSITDVVVRIPPSQPVLSKITSNKLKCAHSESDKSEPKAKFVWYFKNQELDEYKMKLWDIHVDGLRKNVLIIPEFDISKNIGVYKCQAKNEVGAKFSEEEFHMDSTLFGHIVLALSSGMCILAVLGVLLYCVLVKTNQRIGKTGVKERYRKPYEEIDCRRTGFAIANREPYAMAMAEATGLPVSPEIIYPKTP